MHLPAGLASWGRQPRALCCRTCACTIGTAMGVRLAVPRFSTPGPHNACREGPFCGEEPTTNRLQGHGADCGASGDVELRNRRRPNKFLASDPRSRTHNQAHSPKLDLPHFDLTDCSCGTPPNQTARTCPASHLFWILPAPLQPQSQREEGHTANIVPTSCASLRSSLFPIFTTPPPLPHSPCTEQVLAETSGLQYHSSYSHSVRRSITPRYTLPSCLHWVTGWVGS